MLPQAPDEPELPRTSVPGDEPVPGVPRLVEPDEAPQALSVPDEPEPRVSGGLMPKAGLPKQLALLG